MCPYFIRIQSVLTGSNWRFCHFDIPRIKFENVTNEGPDIKACSNAAGAISKNSLVLCLELTTKLRPQPKGSFRKHWKLGLKRNAKQRNPLNTWTQRWVQVPQRFDLWRIKGDRNCVAIYLLSYNMKLEHQICWVRGRESHKNSTAWVVPIQQNHVNHARAGQ